MLFYIGKTDILSEKMTFEQRYERCEGVGRDEL